MDVHYRTNKTEVVYYLTMRMTFQSQFTHNVKVRRKFICYPRSLPISMILKQISTKNPQCELWTYDDNYSGKNTLISAKLIKIILQIQKKNHNHSEWSRCYKNPSRNFTQRMWIVNKIGVILFTVTFNNISAISWRSVLLVEYRRRSPTCRK